VKAFAIEAGGALQLRSEVGRGTTVDILLPRAAGRYEPVDSADAALARLRERLRNSSLGEVLSAWAEACRPGGLPPPASVEVALLEHLAHTVVIAVDATSEPSTFRLVRMGDEIVKALERVLLGEIELNGQELFGSLELAYRRALSSRSPNYQSARYSFGTGPPAQLERLILPAAVDGHTVSHLFGIVLMSAHITEPQTMERCVAEQQNGQ
jgi:hypothetical protein